MFFLDQYPTKPVGIVVKDYKVESHFRSVLKAVTRRAGGTLVTFLVWVFVGGFGPGAQIGLVDTVIKIGPFLHSRKVWGHASFGRREPLDYQI